MCVTFVGNATLIQLESRLATDPNERSLVLEQSSKAHGKVNISDHIHYTNVYPCFSLIIQIVIQWSIPETTFFITVCKFVVDKTMYLKYYSL